MKIAVFVGSLRKKSLNRAVFETYQELASAEFEEIPYHEFPHYNADVQHSGFPEAVLGAGKIIEKSDAILFFSPEYNYSVPGALKNGLDWLSRLPGAPMAGKPASVIGASPGRLGTARMQYHLRQIAVFLDLRFMNKPEVMIGGATHLIDTDSGQVTDEKTRDFLQAHFTSFKLFVGE